jgi:hypothetical protein
MNNTDLEHLINNIPTINIEFDNNDHIKTEYFNEIYYLDDDNFEIEFDKWFIRCSINLVEFGTTTDSTIDSPKEWNSFKKQKLVDIKEIWEEDNQVEFTEEQKNIIEEEIKKCITT